MVSGACPAGTLLHSAVNSRHQLVVDICGQEVSEHPDKPGRGWAVDSVLVRSTKSDKRVEFKPLDEVALQMAFAYYPDVWSADGAYLVLPLGRFEGFLFVAANRALEIPGSGASIRMVTPGGATEIDLMHRFDRWIDGHKFEFTAELSDLSERLTFDIDARRVSRPGGSQFFALVGGRRQKVVRR